MLVTTIIPTYNAEKTLDRAIESVLSQNIPSSELIVIDDGSTDQTARLVRRYKKVRYVRRKNQGVSASRNLGIKMARGKYIAFLDADDQWLPGKLKTQLDFMEANPGTMWMSTGVNYLGEKGEIVRVGRKERKGRVLNDLLDGNFVVISSALIRRECLRAIEKPFFPIGIFYGEDYALWLKLSMKHDFYASPKVLVNYWLSSDQTFLRKVPAANVFRTYGLLTRIVEGCCGPKDINKLRAKMHWELSSIHARRGDWWRTFSETTKALSFFPWSRGGALWCLENAKILWRITLNPIQKNKLGLAPRTKASRP